MWSALWLILQQKCQKNVHSFFNFMKNALISNLKNVADKKSKLKATFITSLSLSKFWGGRRFPCGLRNFRPYSSQPISVLDPVAVWRRVAKSTRANAHLTSRSLPEAICIVCQMGLYYVPEKGRNWREGGGVLHAAALNSRSGNTHSFKIFRYKKNI